MEVSYIMKWVMHMVGWVYAQDIHIAFCSYILGDSASIFVEWWKCVVGSGGGGEGGCLYNGAVSARYSKRV